MPVEGIVRIAPWDEHHRVVDEPRVPVARVLRRLVHADRVEESHVALRCQPAVLRVHLTTVLSAHLQRLEAAKSHTARPRLPRHVPSRISEVAFPSACRLQRRARGANDRIELFKLADLDVFGVANEHCGAFTQVVRHASYAAAPRRAAHGHEWPAKPVGGPFQEAKPIWAAALSVGKGGRVRTRRRPRLLAAGKRRIQGVDGGGLDDHCRRAFLPAQYR